MLSQVLPILFLFSICIITQLNGCFVKSKDDLMKLKEFENFLESREFEEFKEKISFKLNYFVRKMKVKKFEEISEKLDDYKRGRNGPKYK